MVSRTIQQERNENTQGYERGNGWLWSEQVQSALEWQRTVV